MNDSAHEAAFRAVLGASMVLLGACLIASAPVGAGQGFHTQETGKDRIMAVKSKAGTFPAHLPSEMRSVWEEMERQVSPRIGLVGLESLCSQVVRMRDARARIDAEGLVVANPKGDPIPHPALAIEKAASAEVRSWLAKYGGRSLA